MRTLYFDLDGTLLKESFGDVKPALAEGSFERAVRAAGFDRMVCVGNAVGIAYAVRELGQDINPHEMIRDICRDSILDASWFDSITGLVTDPVHRVRDIDFSADWYYADDLAQQYFDTEDMSDVFEKFKGTRVCVPDPDGDGSDLLEWLEGIGKSGESD